MNGNTNTIETYIKQMRRARESLPGVKTEIESRGAKPEFSLVSLPGFNEKIWGLRRGLTIVGGRTSQGKSALVSQWAYDLASQGHRVVLLSLEMTVENIIERMYCNLMGINNYTTLTGRLDPLRWAEFEKKMDVPLLLSCGIGKTFDEINDSFELMDPKPHVMIIDHIQGIRIVGNERENLNEYLRKFRELCLKNKIAGIICSQVSRKVYEDGEKEPCLANLKGTGGLEEQADTVILLHWPYFYDQTKSAEEFKIIIAKQRNGRIGDYKLWFNPVFYKFTDGTIREPQEQQIMEVFGATEPDPFRKEF